MFYLVLLSKSHLAARLLCMEHEEGATMARLSDAPLSIDALSGYSLVHKPFQPLPLRLGLPPPPVLGFHCLWNAGSG